MVTRCRIQLGDRLWRGIVLGSALLIQPAFLASMVGCGSGGRTVPPPSDGTLLRGVVSCYAIAARDLRRPPQQMSELEAVLAPATDDPSKYLRSQRDGEEFVVVWGVSLDEASPATILAYERTGVDGKRMAVNLQGDVVEVTEEELRQLEFPKNHKPLPD